MTSDAVLAVIISILGIVAPFVVLGRIAVDVRASARRRRRARDRRYLMTSGGYRVRR